VTGRIHDLGYRRYLGHRRAVDTRWIVIMRHQLAEAWKTWWRFKVWLVAAALATAIASGFLYFASDRVFRVIGGLGGQVIRFADGILPSSTLWYCKIGYIVSLTTSATVIASDLQSGAFTFYFARSVRPRDYVLGKLAGLGVLLSLIMLAGPLALAGLRLGLADPDELIALSPILGKALVIGVLGTLIYTAVPLGFSALLGSPRYAIALWATYYLLIGEMAKRLAHVAGPAVAAIDLPTALQTVALDLFDLQRTQSDHLAMSTSIALISILGHAALAIAVVHWRVRLAQRTGVGGSS
jgi:hypothetical protein